MPGATRKETNNAARSAGRPPRALSKSSLAKSPTKQNTSFALTAWPACMQLEASYAPSATFHSASCQARKHIGPCAKPSSPVPAHTKLCMSSASRCKSPKAGIRTQRSTLPSHWHSTEARGFAWKFRSRRTVAIAMEGCCVGRWFWRASLCGRHGGFRCSIR